MQNCPMSSWGYPQFRYKTLEATASFKFVGQKLCCFGLRGKDIRSFILEIKQLAEEEGMKLAFYPLVLDGLYPLLEELEVPVLLDHKLVYL